MRARANGECVALSASLRKEQMKVESLERALEQKVNITSFRQKVPNFNDIISSDSETYKAL